VAKEIVALYYIADVAVSDFFSMLVLPAITAF